MIAAPRPRTGRIPGMALVGDERAPAPSVLTPISTRSRRGTDLLPAYPSQDHRRDSGPNRLRAPQLPTSRTCPALQIPRTPWPHRDPSAPLPPVAARHLGRAPPMTSQSAIGPTSGMADDAAQTASASAASRSISASNVKSARLSSASRTSHAVDVVPLLSLCVSAATTSSLPLASKANLPARLTHWLPHSS